MSASNATNVSASTCLTDPFCEPILIVLSVIAACGAFLNSMLIIIFLLDRRLRRPIYIGIPLLALPDMLFLLGKLISMTFVEYFHGAGRHEHPYHLLQMINCVIISAYFSSAAHVVLLSLQQYIFIAFPLQSNVWFKNIKVVIVSVITWVASLSIGIIYVYVVVINKTNNPQLASTFNIVLTFIIIILPVLILTILHFLKKKVLIRSMILRPNRSVRKMARVVSFVIAGYLITTTPVNVKDIIEISYGYIKETWFVIFYEVSTILLFLNYTINPFIYFFSTPQFRRALPGGRKDSGRSGSYAPSLYTSQTSFN